MISSDNSDSFILVSKKKCAKKSHSRKIISKINIDESTNLKSSQIIINLQKYRDTLENSNYFKEFLATFDNEFQRVLGANESEKSCEEKEGVLKIICYGIGRFSEDISSNYQLCFLLMLKHHYKLPKESVFLYDPILDVEELKTLRQLDITPIEVNQAANRKLENAEKVIFYMPHCGRPLYNNLLYSNWSIRHLTNLIIIGNSFRNIIDSTPKRYLEKEAEYILKLDGYTEETRIKNCFDRNVNVFNDLCIHSFKENRLILMEDNCWKCNDKPLYDSNAEIIQ